MEYFKMKKKIIVIIGTLLLIVIIVTPIYTQAKTSTLQFKCLKTEQKIKKKYKKVKIISTGKKCDKAIAHCKGKKYFIVERCTGIVINSRHDGKIRNGSYISYRCVKGVKKGNTVVSYFVYSRSNNACDDIIKRYDVIVEK